MSDNLYEQNFKNLVAHTRGRRKGSLWRADREWVAMSGFNKTADDTMRDLKQAAKDVEAFAKSRADKGWTRSRNQKWIGSIPPSVAFANPELLYDPKAAERFFEDNPKFSAKYWHVNK